MKSGKKLITASLATLFTAAGLVATGSSASAADSPTWCGNWLQNPANASSIRAVPGTTLSGIGNGNTYIRVNEGTYGGRWFAWAKVYNPEQTGKVALIWRYSGNGSLYQCGARDGSATWSWDYTSGVRDTQSSLVQAKYSRNPGIGPTDYAPSVAWR